MPEQKVDSHGTIYQAISNNQQALIKELLVLAKAQGKRYPIVDLVKHAPNTDTLDYLLSLEDFPRLVPLKALEHFIFYGHAKMVKLILEKYLDKINDGDLYAVLSKQLVEGQLRWKADPLGMIAGSCVKNLFPNDRTKHMVEYTRINTMLLNVLENRFQAYLHTGYQIPLE